MRWAGVGALVLGGCTSAGPPELLFASGFEGEVRIDGPKRDYAYLRGRDTETGFSWPIEILGSDEAGLHYIDDEHGEAVFSELQQVEGCDGASSGWMTWRSGRGRRSRAMVGLRSA